MTVKEKLQEWKAQFKENKRFYISGAVCLVAGVIVGAAIKSRPTQIINNNTVAPIFNNNNSSSSVALGGYMHKIVKCNDTNQMWEKVKEASEAAGVSSSLMSRHLNGHHDNICGRTYSIVGVGTR